MDSLFGYPGNKRKIVKSLDYVENTTFIDSFVGAASFLLYNYERVPNGEFIVADRDPAIQTVLYICKSNTVRKEVLKITNELKQEFLDKPTKTWDNVKKTINSCDNPLILAANKLLYQKISHGCIPRTRSKSNTPNVIWSVDKALGLRTWIPELPDLSGCDLIIKSDYKETFIKKNATILLDPPYYAPGKSSCYPRHKPGSPATLLTVLHSIELAIASNPLQLFITHYECQYIDGLLTNFEKDYKISKYVGGYLKSLNYGQGNFTHGLKGTESVEYKDCIWELLRK